MEKIKVENFTFTYPAASSPVIKNLTFSVEAGSFLAIIGPSGSGKSTLLSLLKPELSPKGESSGIITYEGHPINNLTSRESAENIGFVFQDPDKQLVTDKVWHELAFGMESLGIRTSEIRVRTAEVASYLGITDLFERETHTLSGGQKQLVNLASVLCMNPSLILLDEPTAQLDPIASEEFMEILARLHRDTGITIILVEHRLESVAAHCDQLLILEKNAPSLFGDIRECIASLSPTSTVLSAFPASVRLYKALEENMKTTGHRSEATDIPLTISQGRRFIADIIGNKVDNDFKLSPLSLCSFIKPDTAIDFSDVSFSYEKHGPNILKDLDLSLYTGEILTLLGGNGQGKSTLLQLAAGLLKPDYGRIKVCGRDIKKYQNYSLYDTLALLPQQVESLFLKDSVRAELADIEEPFFSMAGLLDTHPYDLSGGEKALLGLNLVLSKDIKILLLDEPTKGLDTENKRIVAEALRSLRDKGISILLITHDLELAALLSDRIALLFDGSITAIDEPHEFFRNNFFYTTHFARMTRGLYTNVILESECVDLAKKNLNEKK